MTSNKVKAEKSGQMVQPLKAATTKEENMVSASSSGPMEAAMLDKSMAICFAAEEPSNGKTEESTMESG